MTQPRSYGGPPTDANLESLADLPRDSMSLLILERRSIRTGFSPEPLDDQDLERVVACGLAAPSSKNSMPWRLHVVTDRDLLAWIADQVVNLSNGDTFVPHDPATGRPRLEYSSTVVASAEILKSVPAAIFLENLGPFSRSVGDLLTAGAERLQPALFGYALEMIGIGASLENMWLAAVSLGIAGAFLGDVVVAEQAIARSLGSSGELLGALALGRSSDGPVPPMDRPALAGTPRVVWHRPGPSS